MERRYTTCNHTSTQRYVDFCEFEKALDWFNSNLRYMVHVHYRRRSEINADSFYEWIEHNTTGFWSRIQERSSVRFLFEKREDALNFQKTYIDRYAEHVDEVGDEEEDVEGDFDVGITVDDAEEDSDDSDETSSSDEDSEEADDLEVNPAIANQITNMFFDELDYVYPREVVQRRERARLTVPSIRIHNYRMSNWDIASILSDEGAEDSQTEQPSIAEEVAELATVWERVSDDTAILAQGVRTPEPAPEPVREDRVTHTVEFTREDYDRIIEQLRMSREQYGNNR